jgi:hypothetical protein
MVAISSIILPLYVYPTLPGFATYYNSIVAYPNVTFNIIVNVDSGPGANSAPNSDYVTAIAKLNALPNAVLHGYVHTSNGQQPRTTVEANITTYANWASHTPEDMHVDGIFFDEAPTDTASVSYMAELSSFAKNALGTGHNHLIFNPGVMPDAGYFPLADQLLVFENYYSAYTDTTINSVPAADLSQSLFMIHGFTDTISRQTQIVQNLLGAGLGGLFISDTDDYSVVSSIWTQFVQAVSLA